MYIDEHINQYIITAKHVHSYLLYTLYYINSSVSIPYIIYTVVLYIIITTILV